MLTRILHTSFLICSSFFILLVQTLPCLAQAGLGDTNLFNNTGVINSPAQINNLGNASNPINSLTRPNFSIGKETGNNAQENWLPPSFPPFPDKYLNIPGLNNTEKEILSQNYFVAVNDHIFPSFSALYENNKLNGISSIVTADSIIHPFLAFQNTVRLKIINASMHNLLKQLLSSMLKVTMRDYELAEDAEVKEEIKYNAAFLLVALKILEPNTIINNIGIKQLVENDLRSLSQGRLAYTTIFHRQEDFSLLEPFGFYQSSSSSQQFYRAYQWLSNLPLELNDTANNTASNNGNEFRRSFLLYQSIVKARVNERSSLAVWRQIQDTVNALCMSNNSHEAQSIYVLPEHMAHAFSSDNGANVRMDALSDPLSRTRLLLAVRSNAPRLFNATSIFSLNKKEADKERHFKFRLFNPLYQPENEIFFPQPIVTKDAATGFSLTPIALLILQNNSIRWANKILADNSAKLNEQFANKLSLSLGNAEKSDTNHFWAICRSLSKGYPYKSPLAIQTANWRTYCLERQAAAWLDGFLAVKSTITDTPPPSTTDNISLAIKKFGMSSWRTSPNFNYLEPASELYKKMADDESVFENSLIQLGVFPDDSLEQSHDFIRLGKRLYNIAHTELEEEPLKSEDQLLLANIDKLLRAIDTPLPGIIYAQFKKDNFDNLNDNLFSPSSTAKDSKAGKEDLPPEQIAGVNMGLGQPTTLYLIHEYKHNYYLLRGATYSYYEQCGLQINQKHWQRQIEFGFLEAPFWCQPFQRSNPRSN